VPCSITFASHSKKKFDVKGLDCK